ncbi:MAG: hypothetical protein JWN86_690 [Planctomycetota bacterium]|nr:hypothetical protein [Planctomycetota bacterium]
MTRRTPKRHRIGFTLVELMIVIVIIGILVGLLLPVIIAAVRRANDARVAAEIQTIAAGLGKFKDRHGEYPPSRVVLSESGVYSAQGTFSTPQTADYALALSDSSITWMKDVNGNSTVRFVSTPSNKHDISLGELAQRSLRSLRKFFPKAILRPVDLTLPPDGKIDYWPDFNGNNTQDAGFIYLEGHECLVFFLGGIPTATTNSNGAISFGMSGFGKEPLFPFKNAGVVAGPVSTSNREPQFYEFKGDRLVDEDGDGIPGYMDPLGAAPAGQFYAYFSAHGAAGYDPNDFDSTTEPQDDAGLVVGNDFRVGVPILGATVPNTTFSPAPNPYTVSAPAPATSGTAIPPAAYVNANSFQIISAGGDQMYGPGGQYSTSGDKLPPPPLPGLRIRENDNVGNFTAGRLN